MKFQLQDENGSALLMAISLMVLLSIPMTVVMGWTEEMRTMAKFFTGPRLEIEFYVRDNLSCAKTKAALAAAGGCGGGTNPPNYKMEIRGTGDQVVVPKAITAFKDSANNVLGYYYLTCTNSTLFNLMVQTPSNPNKYMIHTEFACP